VPSEVQTSTCSRRFQADGAWI